MSAPAQVEPARSTDPAGARGPARRSRNLTAVLLSLISGLGHMYLEHHLLGALLFTLFLCGLNGVFLASTLHTLEHPTTLLWSSLALLVATWVGGLLHAWKLSFGTDRAALEQERRQLLRAGLLDYLRDDLDDASRKLERAVALDVDWNDPDPLFHLGVVQVRLSERHAKRGDQAAARRARRLALNAFRKCEARDPAGKWKHELESEQKRLKRRLTGTGRMRALPPDAIESTEMLPPIAALGPSESGVLPAPSSAPFAPAPGAMGPRSSGKFASVTATPGAPGPGSSGRFAAVPPGPRSSGSFPAVRSSGSFPAVRPAEGGEARPETPPGGSGERPTPARAPGRTSRRLLAKRLKRLLQEELGQDLEEVELEGGSPGSPPRAKDAGPGPEVKEPDPIPSEAPAEDRVGAAPGDNQDPPAEAPSAEPEGERTTGESA